jgi:ATP-binding cassette subfamily B protein
MRFASNIKSLKTLNPYIWNYKGLLFLGIIFIILANLFKVFPAQMVRNSFDIIHENIILSKLSSNSSLKESTYKFFGNIILIYALIIIVLALFNGLFTFLMRQTIIVMSRKIEYDLKNDIYNHLQRLPFGYYRRQNTGDIMARVTEDVSRVRMYLGPAIMYLINMGFMIALTVSIMVSVSLKLTLFVLIPLPILAISIYYVNQLTFLKSTGIQEQLSRITTFSQEIFSGIKVVKSFGSEKSVKDKFEVEAEDYRNRTLSLTKIESLFHPTIMFLISVSTLITLFVGGQEVISGRITPGTLAEFFIYVNMLTWPVASIGWATSLIQRAAASQKRINEVLKVEKEANKGKIKIETLTNKDIEFRNVTFKYPETGIVALKNVSFTLKSGKSLGILGRTGSGKSTIAKLMCGILKPTEGEILFGGVNIEDIQLDDFRNSIGFVPQDDFLFSDTLKNNILFVENEHELDENTIMEESAKLAGLHKDVEQFELKYETRLGERGITLSGGQKQRTSLARAIASKPDILILDDSFSAIDSKTESEILAGLDKIMLNKSTFLISHKISTVKNADIIIYLKEGKVEEIGNHEFLMENGYLYKTLYNKQMIEFELSESK